MADLPKSVPYVSLPPACARTLGSFKTDCAVGESVLHTQAAV